MYYCCGLVLAVECEFVNLATVLRGDRIALGLGEVSVPHRVESSRDVRIAGSSAAHLDIREVRPLDFVFNLHAYSLQADS